MWLFLKGTKVAHPLQSKYYASPVHNTPPAKRRAENAIGVEKQRKDKIQ